MIQAINRTYFVNENLVSRVWKEKDKYYASDKCMARFEIGEMDYHNLVEKLENRVYAKMCSSCPKAKYCHEECVNCEEYDEELEKVVNE